MRRPAQSFAQNRVRRKASHRTACAAPQAMEPFFSVVLSALFLGEAPSGAVLASLLPIVGGVALASASEVTFNWPGFLAAMGSNLISKKFMTRSKARPPQRRPAAALGSRMLPSQSAGVVGVGMARRTGAGQLRRCVHAIVLCRQLTAIIGVRALAHAPAPINAAPAVTPDVRGVTLHPGVSAAGARRAGLAGQH